MRRAVLVLFALMFLLSACGESNGAENTKTEESGHDTQEVIEKKEENVKTLVFPVSNFSTEDPEELKKKFEDAGFEVNLEAEEMKKSECSWNDRDIFSIYAVNKNDKNDMVSSFKEGDKVTGDYVVTIIYIHLIDDVEGVETPEETNSVISEDVKSENIESTVSENPYVKLTKLEVRTQTEYAHAFDDTVILGNNEGVIIKCTVSPATASAEDVLLLCDESEFDTVLQNSYETGNNEVVYEFRITGKKECTDYVYVMSTYDFIKDHDNQYKNTEMYEIYIHKLNATDGKIVYVAPDGDKYHYSKKCAGENAIETTLYDAEAVEYERCRKCS